MGKITFTDVFGNVDTIDSEEPNLDFTGAATEADVQADINKYFTQKQGIQNAELGSNVAYINNAETGLKIQAAANAKDKSDIASAVNQLADYEQKLVLYQQGLIDDAGGVLYNYNNTPDPATTSEAPPQVATAAPGGVPLAALAASYLLF